MMESIELPPYAAKASARTRAEIELDINTRSFAAHGPDEQIRGVRGLFVDPLDEYRRVLTRLTSIEQLDFRRFREVDFHAEPEKVTCVIRHDIDLDIVGARQQAQIEAELGISTTWFVLHTGPYYGLYDEKVKVFRRDEDMASAYLELQQFGHEIAVHTDPLLISQQWDMDGAEALVSELRWMRSIGLDICGTTAHNSVGVYGAANYAIFKNRPRALFEDPADCPAVAEKDGKVAPLQVLDEAELGLTYEANEIFWQREINTVYVVLWSSNRWWWEEEKTNERIKALQRAGEYKGGEFVDTEEFLARCEKLEPGRFLCIVLHPIYYGLRSEISQEPSSPKSVAHRTANSDLGWFTYEPLTIQQHARGDHPQDRSTITKANELGMLDRMPEGEYSSTVLFLGSAAFDALAVPICAQMHCVVEDELEGVRCVKWAHPHMGTAQLYGWFLEYLNQNESPPAHVVLNVSGAENVLSLPENWPASWGFTGAKPAGKLLLTDGSISKPGRFARSVRPIDLAPTAKHMDERELDEITSLWRHWNRAAKSVNSELILVYNNGQQGKGLSSASAAAIAGDLDIPFLDGDALASTSLPDGTWPTQTHREVACALIPHLDQTKDAPSTTND